MQATIPAESPTTLHDPPIRPDRAESGPCPRWPLLLWLSQLAVPLLLLGYASLRAVCGPEPTGRLWAAVGLSAVWIAAVGIATALSTFRRWLLVRRHKLALCFASIAITAIAADVTLTVTGIVPTISARRATSLEYRPGGCTKHRLVPKAFSTAGRDDLKINGRGYLGPEIATAKPPGTTRIAFLGGSQVFGTYWSGGENWPHTAGRILNRRGRSVEVINAGVPNHQTPDCLGKLVTDLWLLEPDLVVICNAWNDIKYFAELTPQKPYADVVPLWHGVDLRLHPGGLDRLLCLSAVYRIGHDQLITMLKGVGDEGEKLRDPTGAVSRFAVRQYRLDLQTICDAGRNIGTRVVLCKQARLATADSPPHVRQRIPYDYTGLPHGELIRAFDACDRVIDEVAAEKGCPVIDLSGPLSGREDVFADHIHFSPTGSRRAAALVADRLEPILDGYVPDGTVRMGLSSPSARRSWTGPE